MKRLGEYVQTADWKKEKHVPVLECPDSVKANECFEIKAQIGKEVSHPNTTEHHIRWIRLFFQPADGKATYLIGNFEFCAHGESSEGPDTGPIYTDHTVVASCKISKPGVIYAISFCNIHGLWENSKEIKLG
jgi:superoxide reductase